MKATRNFPEQGLGVIKTEGQNSKLFFFFKMLMPFSLDCPWVNMSSMTKLRRHVFLHITLDRRQRKTLWSPGEKWEKWQVGSLATWQKRTC
jgi:hypothetical protein